MRRSKNFLPIANNTYMVSSWLWPANSRKHLHQIDSFDLHKLFPFFFQFDGETPVMLVAQSTGAVEYTDWISTEGKDITNECLRYNTKQSDGEFSDILEIWRMRGTPLLPSLLTSDLDMTLNNLMVRFQQCKSFGEWGYALTAISHNECLRYGTK